MKAALSILLFSAVLASAQEDFVPPSNYPVERYEAAWKKNPFTLKTAPIAIERVSFAKDLALGAVYQIGDNTTVVVVNTKTRERYKLVNDQPSSAGIKVKAVYKKDSRKETYVEVEAGGEAATIRYDEAYQKQMMGQQQPPPGALTNASPPGVSTLLTGNQNAAPAQPLAPPAYPNPDAMASSPPGTNGSGPILPNGTAMQNASPNPSAVNAPTRQRRRLLTGPTTTTPAPGNSNPR